MQIIESLNDLCEYFCSLFKSEYFSMLFSLQVKEVTSITVFTDKVLIVLILLSIVEFHDVGGVEGFHALYLTFKVVEKVRFLHETFHGNEFEGELLTLVCLDE